MLVSLVNLILPHLAQLKHWKLASLGKLILLKLPQVKQ